MPFTAAHPALVLPFIKGNPRFISASGLIAGSLAPDFEYFFKLSVNGVHGHTIWGLLYFDIPVAAFLAVVFHAVVKNNLIDNLPASDAIALTGRSSFPFQLLFSEEHDCFPFVLLAGSRFTCAVGFFYSQRGILHTAHILV